MKQLLGFILLILAIPMVVYVALWLCFIGGVVQIISAIKATPVDALAFAIGLARILCTGLAGWFTFFAMLLPGFGLLLSKTRTRFHN
jgi:ABC-type maltose transport system permease subunit